MMQRSKESEMADTFTDRIFVQLWPRRIAGGEVHFEGCDFFSGSGSVAIAVTGGATFSLVKCRMFSGFPGWKLALMALSRRYREKAWSEAVSGLKG